MGDKSAIEWTDATWNPVTGCSKVSPGCDNCYAIRETNRHRNLPNYAGLTKKVVSWNTRTTLDWTGEVRCHPELLDLPLRWKTPRRIFVCSMSDLFHDKVPWEFLCQVFDMMALARQHTFQVLTKRPGRMAYFAEKVWPRYGRGTPSMYMGEWPPNVWAGTSVESQRYAPRLDCLARVPARVRFVSVEPMLGPVDLQNWLGCDAEDRDCLQWVICGGESGPGARPMHPEWARSLRDQCQRAGVPFFFKQNGEYVSVSEVAGPGTHFQFADGATVRRTGKTLAGALLDGREWREWPA